MDMEARNRMVEMMGSIIQTADAASSAIATFGENEWCNNEDRGDLLECYEALTDARNKLALVQQRIIARGN